MAIELSSRVDVMWGSHAKQFWRLGKNALENAILHGRIRLVAVN